MLLSGLFVFVYWFFQTEAKRYRFAFLALFLCNVLLIPTLGLAVATYGLALLLGLMSVVWIIQAAISPLNTGAYQ